MNLVETQLRTHDSLQLSVRTYVPDELNRCGRSLVIVHGTSEHGGRYDHVARIAVKHGWEVIVPDLRGHGRSDGVPVHVDRFEQYLLDFDSLWQYFELNPDRTALLGHSFGGLVCTRFAETRPSRLASLVLMSPLLGLRVQIEPWTLAIGRLMSVVAPQTRFRSKVPVEHTTRDLEVLKRRETDRLLHRSVTARWFFQMKQAIADAWRDAGKLNVPILALQAGNDLIVNPTVVEPWLRTVGSDDARFRMIADHYHELLNEPTWRSTLDDVLDWLDERISLPQGPAHAKPRSR
ncbi:alpha/beta fold hydrolase [bacterium]|nr:alpha/beta fold hydrolase [bacterium]